MCLPNLLSGGLPAGDISRVYPCVCVVLFCVARVCCALLCGARVLCSFVSCKRQTCRQAPSQEIIGKHRASRPSGGGILEEKYLTLRCFQVQKVSFRISKR